MPTLYYTDYSTASVTQQRIVSNFLNINLELHQISQKHRPVILVDDGLVLNQPHAISLSLAASSNLLGHGFEGQIEVYSWIEFFNLQLDPLINQIYSQISGKSETSQKKYTYAVEELKRVLKILDQRLKLRSFLVGDSLTLADVIFACQLQTAFRLVITPEIRKKNVNLTRWFTYVRNLKPFINCSGKLWLCQKQFQINFQQKTEAKIQANKNQNLPIKQESQVKKKTEQKQQKNQKKKKQQEVKSEKAQQHIQSEKKQDSQQFNLDQFKRAFQNEQDKSAVIDKLDNLGNNWSIWKIYYNKDVTQGKVDYLTSNLAKGTLQRLQNLRKIGFGNWGVYFSEETQEYQIRGVMLWKGQDIAQAWKEHPSHQYHIFHKLNPKNQSDKKIIKDYWLQNETSEGLKYYNSFKLI